MTAAMTPETIDFFAAQDATRAATEARTKAREMASGHWHRREWRRAALDALTEGRSFTERNTRQPARRWDGRGAY